MSENNSNETKLPTIEEIEAQMIARVREREKQPPSFAEAMLSLRGKERCPHCGRK